MKINIDSSAVIDVENLIFANCSAEIAEMLKHWKLPDSLTPEQKDGARFILGAAAKEFASAGLTKLKLVPANSQAYQVLAFAKASSKKLTVKKVDPHAGSGPNGQYRSSVQKM